LAEGAFVDAWVGFGPWPAKSWWSSNLKEQKI
jgi:hypothetical protein